jgi:hypothetical protein
MDNVQKHNNYMIPQVKNAIQSVSFKYWTMYGGRNQLTVNTHYVMTAERPKRTVLNT